MHRKAAQPQTQEQFGHGHIASHLPADGHAFALGVAFGNGIGNQSQYGWVAGVIQVGDRFVGAVNRQRVLNQVGRVNGLIARAASEIGNIANPRLTSTAMLQN